MGEQDALFFFLDGLCGWAKMELKRCGVQDIVSVITVAKTLVEFKRESSKAQNKKTSNNGKGGGNWDKSPKQDKPSTFKDKEMAKKYDTPQKYSCFLVVVLTGSLNALRRENLPPLSK